MKTYKLAEAEKLLIEIAEWLNDDMRWITKRRLRQDIDDETSLNLFEAHETFLFNIHTEMKEIYDKIQEYLKEE